MTTVFIYVPFLASSNFASLTPYLVFINDPATVTDFYPAIKTSTVISFEEIEVAELAGLFQL
jgi:hypothetical protein